MLQRSGEAALGVVGCGVASVMIFADGEGFGPVACANEVFRLVVGSTGEGFELLVDGARKSFGLVIGGTGEVSE